MYVKLKLCILFLITYVGREIQVECQNGTVVVHCPKFRQNPAPDSHRCGKCPTYFQKICAFDRCFNTTKIFDNHCIMDLYNCFHGTIYEPIEYERCVYFGNFAYVHGFKHSQKYVYVPGEPLFPDYHDRNPDFV